MFAIILYVSSLSVFGFLMKQICTDSKQNLMISTRKAQMCLLIFEVSVCACLRTSKAQKKFNIETHVCRTKLVKVRLHNIPPNDVADMAGRH